MLIFVFLAGPFRRCPDEITEGAFDDCVYDGCALRPDTTTICETFADTMKLCQRMGFEIDQWRRNDFCRKFIQAVHN